MNFKTTWITSTTLSIGLAIIILFVAISSGLAQENDVYIRRIPSMEQDDTGPLHPVGLTFSSSSDSFYVVEAQGQTATFNSDVIAISPFANRKSTARIAATLEDPLNVVFDNQNKRLLAYLPTTGQILEVKENAGGDLDRTTTLRHNASRLGIQEPRGLTLDEKGGGLFILDAVGPRIVRVPLGPGRSFTGGKISVIDLSSSGLVAPRGVAFDPTTGHLHVFDLSDQKLYELDQNGRLIAARNLLPFGLKSPGAMVFAPSGDQTDDPAQMSLFLADSGLITGRGSGPVAPGSPQVQAGANTSTQSSGQILELSLVQPAAAAASTFVSTIIKVTNLAAVSPPSPDPSGIAYVPSNNRLIVSDGEVEETVSGTTHFQGANVWELSLGGAVIRSSNISAVKPTSVPMSDEPTGAAWNPNNGHYYFSDDTGSIDVYDLNPGPDALVGTGDDTWSGFSGSSYGNGDAEGIAYDTFNNHLFVADGVNAEVYEYTLAGALVNHFDVRAFGVMDPESVEFNPNTGTLFVMSSNLASPVIVETTTAGALLQTIDISAANMTAAAGLAYAPASNGSGTRRFYIVDRGIDNNDNPNIVDGKLFEMSAPLPGATPTPSNTATIGPSPTSTPTSAAAGNSFYASFALSGTLGSVSFADEDILFFDGQTWSMVFDGSDVGASTVDLWGLSRVDADTFLLAFSNTVTLSGGLTVAPTDIVRFDATSLGANTAGTFSLYFNGADVGLEDATAEKIDALSVLPDGRILISATGDPIVPGVSATKDEDVLAFTPLTLGNATSGSWSMYFDGSDVSLDTASSEDLDGVDLAGGNLYLSTIGGFAVSGLSGAGEDIFVCAPASLGDLTACNFSPSLFFDGSPLGLTGNSLDGLDLDSGISGALAPLVAMPLNIPPATDTPTETPTSQSTSTPTDPPTPTPTPTDTPSS